MKRIHYIILVLFALSTSVVAQNPIETKFTVNYTTEQGNDTTIEIATTNKNSFNFVGGHGTVTHYKPSGYDFEEQTEEENKDIYGWIEDLDYSSATLFIYQRYLDSQSEFGFCISKTSGVTSLQYEADSMYIQAVGLVTSNTHNIWDNIEINIDNYELGEINTFRLFPENSKFSSAAQISLKGLDYMTTYYYRPYVKFYDGQIMYGGEKSFTTPRTIEGALNKEKDFAGGYYHDSETGVALNSTCLKSLFDQHPDQYKGTESSPYSGLQKSLQYLLTSEDLATLKSNSYRSIECTDGNLYLVNEIPADMADRIYNSASDTIIIKATESALAMDTNASGVGLYTKNVGTTSLVNCDETWGVPDNSYLDLLQSGSTNPSIAFNISPHIPLANTTYEMYATFVNPDPEGDPRANRFYTYVWERQISGDKEGEFPLSGTRLANPDGSGNYFITKTDSQRVDRLYLGEYTFSSYNDAMIQFVCQVPASKTKTYNRQMRIAQIEFIPKKDE